ncbi:MAG: hypothetical protein ACI9OD_004689 [Limisphaerales bacterium]
MGMPETSHSGSANRFQAAGFEIVESVLSLESVVVVIHIEYVSQPLPGGLEWAIG